MAEITRHAAITRGNFYNHFTDLNDAIQSLEDEQLTQLTTILKGTRAIHGGDQNEKNFTKKSCFKLNETRIPISNFYLITVP
ncbi:TetR/AcrR family transcriptional regulator [Fructobacillus fructosus]|uniref:TetR/AcrR family transcriptional regulator n=1 Tax=Fructobacillus fructosus TaxID=1631 RepID=UPI00200AF57D|nr:TetR/AcrR family transcriptional regulator [Fructobacillus fructosus]MCK8637994.1 TetR/AcrR family transcriptional regulator [Fructobacillus fructosus]